MDILIGTLLWLLPYGAMIFVPFLVLGQAMRRGIGKNLGVVAILLTLSHMISGVPLFALVFASSGLLTGRFVNINQRIPRLAFWAALLLAVFETLWPSRLIFFSPLTVNRPTLLRLFQGIVQGTQYHRGVTLYFQGEPIAEQEVTLFGKYPILVGYPDHIKMLRVELQVLISIAAFFLILLVVLGIMRGLGKRDRKIGLLIAGSIFGIGLLPIHGFILITVAASFLIGTYVHRSGLSPRCLTSIPFGSALLIVAAYIAFYHLSFSEGLTDGFSHAEINWLSTYSDIGVFSLLLGTTLAAVNKTQK